jgi:hypothetical protein
VNELEEELDRLRFDYECYIANHWTEVHLHPECGEDKWMHDHQMPINPEDYQENQTINESDEVIVLTKLFHDNYTGIDLQCGLKGLTSYNDDEAYEVVFQDIDETFTIPAEYLAKIK